MILSAGLSPAWQQILCFRSLELGEVNRAEEAAWCASGKVINVAVAAASLGEDVTLISAIGGISGDVIQRELQYLGLRAEWIYTGTATRVCTTLLTANGETTELVENMGPIEEAALADFVDRTRIYANVAHLTVLSGSLPADAPPDVFAQVMRSTHKRFILDVRGEPLLHCLAFAPFLVKPNRQELAFTLGRPVETEPQLLAGMRELNRLGAQWVVVSDGAKGVWVTSEESTFRCVPPQVSVVNPIGCGDALAAGLAVGLRGQDDVPTAVALGMGAAAQNAELLLPARLNPERCRELAERVQIQEWN